MRTLMLALLFAGQLSGQPAKPQDAFFQERERLNQQAKTAFDAEMVREKAGDCPNATTTFDINACLSKELEKSDANRKAYSDAIRSLLSQKRPWDDSPLPGPTGTPLTGQEQLRDFNAAEGAWSAYRTAFCDKGVFGFYKGGSILHSAVMGCELMLIRSHLRELNATYGEALSR